MVESSLFSFLEERQPGSNLVMDIAELTKIIYTRIQRFEPDNVSKIFGCIFLREPDEHDMMQLAYGSEVTLISHINDAKATLAILSSRTSSQIQCPNPNFSMGPTYHPLMGSRNNNHNNSNSVNIPSKPNIPFYDPYDHHHYTRNLTDSQLIGFDEQCNPVNNLSGYMPNLNMYHDPIVQRRVPNPPIPVQVSPIPTHVPKRPCHYYIKGMCKNGLNCNYAHHNIPLDLFESDTGTSGTGTSGTPVELEKLEMEIVELLKSNTRQPVSIASLPTLYGEMYGKNIQAEGYLTESQRHGKAGYSLTKLLCRLTKIVVIERPHGQHAVVLAEDAYKFLECGNEKMDGTQNPASSHQIYLTFPADSTFTEEDVLTYFSQYGPVRDVRIPCQDRRMFGFVSFHNADTVHLILANRHPHFICGARVLVKPYREKTKNFMKAPIGYNPHHTDMDPELYPLPGDLEASMMIKRQLLESQERMSQIELERMRLRDLDIASMGSHVSYSNSKLISDEKEFDSIDPVRYTLDVLNTGTSTSSHSSALQVSGNSIENESYHVELPENPFGSTP